MVVDWISGKIEQIQIEEGRKPDQIIGQELLKSKKEGALWLLDLGFWSLEYVRKISEDKSYYLCRLK
jgi:hypothetical protein